ncbi:MAG: hypothetical protein JW940_21605 [Polyangiaceae bacterium]|nr:hypothetical protein [Polyangiaceae bacterium]
MALGSTWRVYARNQSGESLDAGDIDLEFKLWKYDSSGALSYSSEVTRSNNASIADDADGNCNGATGYEDNSSDKYLGLHGRATVTTGTGATDGLVELWLQFSPDGGTDWPISRQGVLLAVILTPSASTYIQQIQY